MAERDLRFLGLIVMENRVKPETTPVIAQLRAALEAELDLNIMRMGAPLDEHALYDPRKASQLPAVDRDQLASMAFELPVARAARKRCLLLPHPVLLGTHRDMDDIVAAMTKVQRNARQLRSTSSA